MGSRIVVIAAWSRPIDGFPSDFGKRRAGREPLNQIGDVGFVERTFPSSFLIMPILPGCLMTACHKVPIQFLSLFASITTTSGSLVPSATAAIP
jgi:hypothetical protein